MVQCLNQITARTDICPHCPHHQNRPNEHWRTLQSEDSEVRRTTTGVLGTLRTLTVSLTFNSKGTNSLSVHGSGMHRWGTINITIFCASLNGQMKWSKENTYFSSGVNFLPSLGLGVYNLYHFRRSRLFKILIFSQYTSTIPLRKILLYLFH